MSETTDYYHLSSFDTNHNLRVVIETPVGSHHKITYRSERQSFVTDSVNTESSDIQFLPYLVNVGFIPSTDVSKDKQPEPLKAMVYAKILNTAQVLAVKPVGMLKMLINGKTDYKVLCVPVEKKFQLMDIKNFEDLSEHHPELRQMIADWFLHDNKNNDVQMAGWSDESNAMSIIKAYQKFKPLKNGE
jgi:inorganic pyrophosphatase